MAVINGTPGDDRIEDTDGDDVINGGDGDDRLLNGRGNDVIYGGAGNDRIVRFNQTGVDQLFGEDGNDFIDSNVTAGNQLVDGGAGDDLLYLGFFASSGNGNVFAARGGAGQDGVVLGQGGSGTINVGTGRFSNLVLNTIDLGTDNDFLTLTGSSFSRITLGAGSDTIQIGYDIGTAKGEWPDYVSFTDYTPGVDRISALHFNPNSLVGWNGTTNPFAAGLLRLVQNGADAVLERNLGTSYHEFIRFENVQVSALTAADFGGYDPSGAKPAGLVITGTEGNDERVLSGDSRIIGGLVGGAGDDRISGLGGNDFIIAYGGDDDIDGGAGDDFIFGGAGNDIVRGGIGADDIRGGEGSDRLFGEAGDDRITVQSLTDGNTFVDGGSGNDTIVLAPDTGATTTRSYTLLGGEGQDQVDVASVRTSGNTVDLGAGNDRIIISGRTGATVTLGAGADTVDFAALPQNGEPLVTIADYAPGVDRVALRFSSLLQGWNGVDSPFASGHLRLLERGKDTILQVDRDGGGNAFENWAVFSNLSAFRFGASDFFGFQPTVFVEPGVAVTGTAGNDVLVGSERGDQLTGLDGADTFRGLGGSDVLDGGAGLDTSVYAGAYRSYVTALNNGGGTVSEGREGGTDRLTSVETLRFADGVLTFDPDSRAAQIARMYDTVLQRAPDTPGLEFYLDEMERGASLLSIAQAFLGSAEFQRATGSLSNAQYVDYLYTTALGRASDAGGKAYWVGQLDSGAQSRADLLVGFSESREHRDLTSGLVAQGFFETDDAYQAVALLYDSFNQRRPDEEGLVFYGEAVKNGTFTLAQIADQFAGSAEFRAATAGMNNEQIVDFMYRNTLDRLPDAEGRAYYVNQLNSGAMDLGDILLDFSQSAEHTNLIIADITGGIALAGMAPSASSSTTADVESTRMLMQAPDTLQAFEQAGTAPDLALASFAGVNGGLDHLGAASRLDVHGF